MLLRLLLRSALIFWVVGSNLAEPCCECWNKCFAEPMSCDQAAIYNIVTKLHGTKIAQNIKGTVFMLDGSSQDSAVWKYQGMLAALIAMTEPVSNDCPGNCCNPFFLNVYQSGFAYYDWDWQCLDRCSVSQVLLNLPQTPQVATNWVGGGCILADHAMLSPYYHNCSRSVDPAKRMAIAFMNNDQQLNEYETYCDTIPYRAAVRIGNPFHPNTYLTFAQEGASPSLDYSHPASLNILDTYSKARSATLESLLTCVTTSCCPERGLPTNFTTTAEPVKLGYINQTSDTIITETFANLSEFLDSALAGGSADTATTKPAPHA